MKRILACIVALSAIALGVEASTYQLFVQSTTQVTDDNKDDVLGDGTVKFDPSTFTLTLNGANLTGEGYDTYGVCNYTYNGPVPGDIAISKLTIWVEGDCKVTTDDDCFFFRSAHVTITGPGKLTLTSRQQYATNVVTSWLKIVDADVSFMGSACAINGTGSTLTVDHSSLTANSQRGELATIRNFNEMEMIDCRFDDADCGSGGYWYAQHFFYDDGTCELWYDGDYTDMGHDNDWNDAYPFLVLIVPAMKIYDLKVDGTSVTDRNKGDVLGDGTVAFDNYSSTLTFTDADITSSGPCVYSRLQDLTLKFLGANSLVSTSASGDVIQVDGSMRDLYLRGDGSVLLQGYSGISADADVLGIANDLQLTVQATAVALAGNRDRTTLFFGGYSTEAHLHGMLSVVDFKTLNLADDISLVEPVGVYWSYALSRYVDSDGNEILNQPFVFRGPPRLWVGGKRVNDSNMSDILGNGQASYDRDSHTLTLTNATLSFEKICVLAEIDDLTICFRGDNMLVGDDEVILYRNANGNLTLTGNGSAVLNGKMGIIVSGQESTSLSIEGGLQLTLNTNAPNVGNCAISTSTLIPATIRVSGNGTELNINTEKSYPVCNFKKFILDDALTVYAPAGAYFDEGPGVFRLADTTPMTSEGLQIRMPDIPVDADHFPDDMFRQELTSRYGSKITPADIRMGDVLFFSFKGIEDLTGIAYFTEATRIMAPGNRLSTADFSHNRRLSVVEVCQNYIEGEGMDLLIESLPQRPQEDMGGFFVLCNDPTAPVAEHNKMTLSQVEAANAKGWMPLAYDQSFGDFVEYDGRQPTAIRQIAASSASDATFTLGGQRLAGQPTLRGIYIRNGRKVVVR